MKRARPKRNRPTNRPVLEPLSIMGFLFAGEMIIDGHQLVFLTDSTVLPSSSFTLSTISLLEKGFVI